MSKEKHKIIGIVGSTASGKSDLALKLARVHGAAILSCDSLLVYKGLDIGTAKPTKDELRDVIHFGIDLCDISQVFNAGDYVRYATPIIEDFVAKKKPLLIVGGTGFYFKALVCGVWSAPPTQPEFRLKIENRIKELGIQDAKKILHAELSVKDPEYAKKVNANDIYRVIRGLEIIQSSNKSVTEILKNTENQGGLSIDIPIFGMTRTKEDLEKRIIKRTEQMFSLGLVNEVKNLLQTFQGKEVPKALGAVGYAEVQDLLAGNTLINECKERVVISTRQLAKKQRTFFNTFPKPIKWVTIPQDEQLLFEEASKLLV